MGQVKQQPFTAEYVAESVNTQFLLSSAYTGEASRPADGSESP
jgi:hypothetical protein